MAQGTASEIKMLALNKIKLGGNSRMSVSKEELDGLMQSMKEVGLLQPIGVVKQDNGGYEVAYGNRRFLAASKLGLSHIPAVIHVNTSKGDVELKNLTENIQRRNISLQEAGRYMTLLKDGGLTTREISVRIGVTPHYVDTCLKAYGEVPKKYQKDLEVRTTNTKRTPGKISIQAARAIINAQKTLNIPDSRMAPLWEEAKKDDQRVANNAMDMAKKIKSTGSVKGARVVHSCTLNFRLSDKEWERLQDKHIHNGQFSTMKALYLAILSGQINEQIKFT